jgi:hypothetical protein
MPMTLENRMRQMQVFNLPHHAYCKDDCACSDTAVLVVAENPRNGERALRRIERKTPSSLTLLAGERRSDLPMALLDVPEVKAAIACGRVRIIEQTPEKTARPAAAANTSQSAAGPAQKEKEK